MDSKSGTGWRPGSELSRAAVRAAAAFDADAGEAREPEDVEDIFRAGGSTDDVAGQGFGDVDALEFGDGAEGVEDFAGLRSEGGGKWRAVGGFLKTPGVWASSAMAAAWTRACWRMSSVCRWRP